MKILFVLENYLPHIGGVESLFKNMTEGLVRERNKVTILTHRIKGTKSTEIINGVNIHRISCFHSRYWFTLLSIPLVLKYAKNTDMLHTTTYNGSLPARIAARVYRKPSIITVHEILGKNWEKFGMNYLSAKFHQLLEWLITKLRFDVFIAVSESTKSELIKAGVKEERIKVVYNGVDYEHFNPRDYDRQTGRKKMNLDNNFVYTFYGRPGISKGLEYLLKAVPDISSKIQNSKLMLIISKSPKRRYNYIMSLIKKAGLERSILLVEPVRYEELPTYLIASDCIVVPSLTEGFGYAVAEACALGIPVVATNTTSIPEVISGKFVLVEPSNPNAIAEGVIKVYNKKYSITRLKRFTIADNTKNYLKIYHILAD